VRDSPALNVAGQIQLQGAQVTVYDPRGNDNARALFPTLRYASGVNEACESADLVLHLTEWREFRGIDPTALGGIVKEKRIIDARNALDPAVWRAAGWTYGALGRP
jgi:UDPglucose 6-dehydrogenase